MGAKKVILIGPAYPFRGGIAEFNNYLCKTYQNLGFECKVLSFSLQYPGFLFPGTSQFEEEKRDINIPSERLINSINPLSWFKAARFIKKFKPDYVVVAYWIPFIGISTGFISWLVKRKTKVLVLAHNVKPHDRKPFDNLITNKFLKQARGVVLLSKAVEKELDEFDTKKPRLIGFHPVYDMFGQKVSKQEALEKLELPQGKYVLFFGLIKKYKGLDVLLKSFGTQKLKDSGIKLIVAGEFYDSEEYYRKLVDDLGIKTKVYFYDYFIPTGLVKYFFSVADAIILPYVSATQSGVTQVAYHFELPMIASDVGALPDLVPDKKAGFIFKAGDYNQLADKILELYENGNLEHFKNFVAQKKKDFSWEELVKKIDSFANSL